jgi:hypothetical protein
MHSALIVIEKPTDEDREALGRWTAFAHNFPIPRTHIEGVEVLGETVWLIQPKKAMKVFGDLIYQLEYWSIPYRAVFFEEEPEWAYSSKHPLAEKAKTPEK